MMLLFFSLTPDVYMLENTNVSIESFVSVNKGSYDENWQDVTFSLDFLSFRPDGYVVTGDMGGLFSSSLCLGNNYSSPTFTVYDNCTRNSFHITALGGLYLSPAPSRYGIARFRVSLLDNGGSILGGRESYVQQSPLTINVLPQPKIYSVAPRIGSFLGGVVITIRGKFFGSFYRNIQHSFSIRSVFVGSSICDPVLYTSDSEIHCLVASNITSGDISVEIETSAAKLINSSSEPRLTGSLSTENGFRQVVYVVAGMANSDNPHESANGFLGIGGFAGDPQSTFEFCPIILARKVNAVAVYNNEIYAGGTFQDVAVQEFSNLSSSKFVVNYIFRYNGDKLQTVGSGTNGEVHILLEFEGALLVGGSFSESYSNKGIKSSLGSLVLWNKSTESFSSLPGIPSAIANGIILAAASSGQILFVGGRFNVPDTVSNSFHGVAKYDSIQKKWFALGGGLKQGEVMSIVLQKSKDYRCSDASDAKLDCLGDSGLVFAGGSFRMTGTFEEVTGVAKWENGSWLGMGGVLNGITYALAYVEDWLFVGGNFSRINLGYKTLYVENIAMWKDNIWYPIPGGGSVSGSVFSLLYIQNCMYVGGSFGKVCGSNQEPDLVQNKSCDSEIDPARHTLVNGVARFCWQNRTRENSSLPLFFAWEPVKLKTVGVGRIQVRTLAAFLPSSSGVLET
mmetsp:Transcript_36805/g.76849  ORF Transcript_36805/g.76849 Transcript_36805/m.76849 type:complete len:679 (-) Transcript_36805:762-2798(-)